MIYRLRRKFIRICTLSFLAVFVALFLDIYLVTYFQTTSSLDQLADIVSENGGHFPSFQAPGPQESLPARGAGPRKRLSPPGFSRSFSTHRGKRSLQMWAPLPASHRRKRPGWEKKPWKKAAPGAG